MLVDVQILILTLVVFQTKHLIADFSLQTNWMFVGKEQRKDWLAPLAAHAGTHAAFTLLIALWFAPLLWWLAPVDLMLHATIDRGKTLASRGLAGKEGDRMWWQIFGTDQMLHHLTHLAYSMIIVLYR
jgi:Protein of unknown function (DUF3307)